MSGLTKKLLLSVLTWVLIFVTLGTSTFAWFSMNYEVVAEDLQITVTSNATYLLIGNTADIKDNKYGLSKETVPALVSGSEDFMVFPAFYGDGSTLGTENPVTTVPGKWYTALSADYDKSKVKVYNVSEIPSNQFDNYVLTYEAYLTLSGDSSPYNKQLVINFDKTGDRSVSAVVKLETSLEGRDPVTKDEYFHFDLKGSQTTAGNIYVTKDTAYKITIYVYINGNGDNINTRYAMLNEIVGDITISFDIFA